MDWRDALRGWRLGGVGEGGVGEGTEGCTPFCNWAAKVALQCDDRWEYAAGELQPAFYLFHPFKLLVYCIFSWD